MQERAEHTLDELNADLNKWDKYRLAAFTVFSIATASFIANYELAKNAADQQDLTALAFLTGSLISLGVSVRSGLRGITFTRRANNIVNKATSQGLIAEGTLIRSISEPNQQAS